MERDKILNETRGGLDIILHLYPQAEVCLRNKQAKFKKRDGEKTASAHLIQKDGVWYLKDFGEPGKGLNAISLWMEHRGMDKSRYGEALMQIARQFNITDELDRSVNMPKFVKREARSDEPDGEVVFRLKEKFSKEELRLLGPRVTQETCDALHWHSVEWIGKAKDRKITEKHSTDTYPIFMRECVIEPASGESEERKFYKLYEPKNTEKGFRFQYFPTGAKEPDYINGLIEARQARAALIGDARRDWETSHPDSQPFNDSKVKLPEIVICSGERDALCVRSHGYCPVWLNSETAQIDDFQYRQLTAIAETVYNIPDIDNTGIYAGTQLALRHIGIMTAWLPDKLKDYRDHRNKPRKDLRDWMDLRPERQDFRNLLMRAKPAQFWQQTTDKNGRQRYEIDTEYLFHFLWLNGFAVLHDDNAQEPHFIRMEGNVVRNVTPREIRSFVRQWAQDDDNTQHHNIRNLVLNSSRLTPSSLEGLQEVNLDFTAYTATSQLFYFKNGTAEVSADGVKWYRRSDNHDIDKYVWEDNVIAHNYKELPDMFRLNVVSVDDGQPVLSLDILDSESSHVFGYMINSSRIHWRKEMETPFETAEQRAAYRSAHKFDIKGEGLTPTEKVEQIKNLVNKMFALGYILHEYKSPSRAWALMAMDNKIGENDECNGGSGKSFFCTFLKQMRQVEHKSGRAGDLTKNPHWLDRVTQFTQILEIDDLDDRMPASFFYDNITGPMEVNPKQVKSFVIPFKDSPKIVMSTNYVPSDFDPSSERRLIYMVYSDYYHARKTDEDNYLETRTIFDDFNKDIFGDAYTEEEWNADFNFAIQCVRMYLRLASEFPGMKLQPPMDNILTRKLKRDIGENFEEWAYQYFAEDGGHLDRQLVRTEVFEDYKRYSNVGSIKMKGFSRKLRAFVALCPYIYEMDPEEYRNGSGRNISYNDDPLNPGQKKTVEMLYVRSIKAERQRRREREVYGAETF